MEVALQIEVDNQPDRYTLSASLSAVLGLKQATRTTVLHTLWAYIKTHRLQVFLSGIKHLLSNGFFVIAGLRVCILEHSPAAMFVGTMQQSEKDYTVLLQQAVNYTGSMMMGNSR